MATSTTGGHRNPVEALAEEFLDRRRRGEPATPEEYAEAHPELADEILALFPSLLMMEDLAADSGGQTGSLTSGAGVIAGAVAGRFGDFRLLREVGRGGMGVVYEAEQESLGRRVALKVLPAGALVDPRQVRRFEREARSAARLHHTSIVPVFGVGQHEGTHYYVMQFIQGQGLDAVLEELRQLRDSRTRKPATPAGGVTATEAARRRDASEIARSLATGRFVGGPGDVGVPPGSYTLPWSSTGPQPAAPPSSEPGSSATSGVTSLPETDRRFALGVARIGVQVAEALAYAHGQGILHRDIKPSNLLLDRDGNVWVADFGLAKATGGEDLTHTGDILGTVRYMAPERFRGEGDSRADLYALGLTLYELLALRPAYQEKDRAGLIRQVMEEDPPRLRKLNRRVPPDLETIVHKAIAREPGQRYASARAMAEDLQRFLDGRPIRARRVSPWERAWRWCKRNPAVAGLLGTVALLLVGISVASAGAAAHFRAMARKEELAREEAERASRLAEESRRQAEAARAQAEAARAEAQRQSRAADASFARARQAVDDSFTRVSESKLLNVPGLRALRADLLGSALAFYDQFLREHGDDPSLKRDALRIRLNVARVLWELGRTEKSKDASRAAAAGYEQALREDPEAPDLKAGLAEALYRSSIGQRAETTIAGLRRAVALREEVLKARPGDLENRRELAQFYNDLGVALDKVDPAERLAAYDRCVALRLELAGARPDDPDVLHGLFQSFNNLAAAIHSQGNTGQSLNLYRRAEEFGREALRLQPNDADLAHGMRIVSRNVSGDLWALGRNDEAIAECREAVEMLRAMARANPEAPAIQAAYIQTSERLAHFLAEHGQPEEAVRALMGAIGAFDRYYRDTAENLMSVANQRMAFARRIGEIKPGLTPEQKAARDALVDRAIDDYREAVARGAGLNIGALRKQPLLKDHPRFAALVAEADAVAKARLDGRAAAGAGAPSGPRTAPARPKIDVRLGRATAWSALGLARAGARNGQADEALATLDRARALFDELARERPGDPDVARGRAELRLDTLAALHGLSLASLKAGRADESASYRRRADALFEGLPRSGPAGAAAAAVRVDALIALAEFHRKQGRWPETYRALRDAEALIGRAFDSTPDEATARMLEPPLELLGFEYFRLYLLEDAARAFRLRFVRPSPHQTAFMGLMHALALLLDDDVPGYRALCARMIERYRSSRQSGDLGRLVRVVTLRPDTLTDWGPIVAMGRRSAELAPENDRAPFGTQLALIRAGRGRETLAWMESNPFFSTWLPRAMIHRRLGQTAEARAWLRKSDDYLRDFTEVALAGEGSPQQGWWWAENWGMSVIWSREAHELIDGRPWPDAAWMRLQRARVLARVGEASRSDAEFDAMLADRPDDPEVWLGRAQADAWLGRLDRARDDADRAARIGPGTALGWETLGRALAAAGRAADAARAFARAVERARDEPGGDREAHLRRAQIWVVLDRPEEASRDFARALDLSRTAGDPAVKETIDLLFEALNLYLRDRRWGAALALLGEMSGRAPSAADFQAAGKEDVLARDLSALLAINGDREGWARHNARVLDGLRGDRAPTSTAHLPAAVSLAPWPAGDPGRVLALCERVSARFPRSIAPYYLAMAHLRAGRPAEALRRIAAADRTPSARYPARRLIDLVAAIAHHRLGHAAEARRLYDESLRWFRAQQGGTLGWWPDPFVYNALTYEALRREAEALIVLDPAFPADPFAP